MPQSAALLSAVQPYPADAGKKVVLAGFVEYLVDRLGSENVHYILIGGEPAPKFPTRLHQIPGPSVAAALGNVMSRAAIGRASLQESLLRSRTVGTMISRTLDGVRADLEIYDTIRMGQYAQTSGSAQQICYLDDLFSHRYDSMLRATRTFPDVDIAPLGNFATHVPARLRPLATNKVSQELLLRAERRLVRCSEDASAAQFSSVLLMNESEAALLRGRTASPDGRVRSVPPLINEPRFFRDYHGAPEFVFLGLLSLPHNDDGLRAFLTDVWPKVRSAQPQAVLRVIGKDPRPGLLDEVARLGDSVVLEGYVDDLGALLGRAAALINPLRFGSGIKLKIIEGLGRGVPIVSTTIGADGVAVGADQGVLVSDDNDEMADLLLDLTRPDRNAELAAAAHEHFRRCYARTAVYDCYDRAFGGS